MRRLLPLAVTSVLLMACGTQRGAVTPTPEPVTSRAFAVTGDALHRLVLSGPGNDEKRATLGQVGKVTDMARDGQDLYAVTFDSLFRIDPATSAVSRVGTMGAENINALAADAGGVLYAASFGGSLYRLDKTTGRASFVMNLGRTSSGDLAFSADGTLYATVQDTPDSDLLLRVDLAARTATGVGRIGYGAVFGLGVQDGTLYGLTEAGQLLTVNPATGAGTLVRNLSLGFTGMQ